MIKYVRQRRWTWKWFMPWINRFRICLTTSFNNHANILWGLFKLIICQFCFARSSCLAASLVVCRPLAFLPPGGGGVHKVMRQWAICSPNTGLIWLIHLRTWAFSRGAVYAHVRRDENWGGFCGCKLWGPHKIWGGVVGSELYIFVCCIVIFCSTDAIKSVRYFLAPTPAHFLFSSPHLRQRLLKCVKKREHTRPRSSNIYKLHEK